MAQDGYGNLTGVIKVEGTIPKPIKVDVNKDAAVCLANGNEVYDQSLLISENNELEGAFVLLYLKRGQKVDIHPDLKDAPEVSAVMDNNKCIFVPANLALRTGQKLVVKNSDPAGHNFNFSSFANQININIPANGEAEHTFDKVDKVPGVVKCDIHPWMTGYMIVRDDPYFSVTGKDGKFMIEKLPAGTWGFQFWHNRCGYMKDLTKDGDKFLGKRGEFEVEIKDGETVDLGELLIKAASLAEKG